MTDPLPVPSAAEQEITPPTESETPPPTPEETVAAAYAEMRSHGGLIFDAFYAYAARDRARATVPPRIRKALPRNPQVAPYVEKADRERQAAKFQVKMLEASGVFVLDADAMRRLFERAHAHLYDPVDVPFWHRYPLWIEWDDAYFGDTNAPHKQPCAIWAYPASELVDGHWTNMLRAEVLSLDYTSEALVYLVNGTWAYECVGRCQRQPTCAIAQSMRPDQRHLIQELRDERRAMESGCACYNDGRFLARLFSGLAAFLRDSDRHMTTHGRKRPLPPRPTSGRRALDAWQQSCAEIKAWNKAHPDYACIS